MLFTNNNKVNNQTTNVIDNNTYLNKSFSIFSKAITHEASIGGNIPCS